MNLTTLVLANFALLVFAAAALACLRRAYPEAAGVVWFERCAASLALGAGLISWAGLLPRGAGGLGRGALLTAGNGLLVLGFALLNRGIADYWSRPWRGSGWHAALLLAQAAVYAPLASAAAGRGAHIGPRAVIVGGAMALELGLGSWMFARERARPAALAMAAFAVFNLARGPLTWSAAAHPARVRWVLAATDYGFLLLGVMLALALVWMVIVDLRTRLGRLARTDDLTGLLNRRALEIETAQITGSSALLVMDLDHFKQLNDRFGHAAGDHALREVAAFLRTALPTGDITARVGGEEFVMLLADLDLEAALATAERLRQGIAELRLQWGPLVAAPGDQREPARPRPPAALPERRALALTASFGVAVPEDAAETWSELLQRADLALYEAKEAGRNCVRAASAAARAR